MSIIKWYKEGEFEEENFSNKIVIAKFCYKKLTKFDDSYSENGYRYVMGYLNNSIYNIITDIETMNTTDLERNRIEILPISYTDSINLKLNNKFITSPCVSVVKGFRSWTYSDLLKIVKKSDIEFYREK
jgi:hypothetical protein